MDPDNLKIVLAMMLASIVTVLLMLVLSRPSTPVPVEYPDQPIQVLICKVLQNEVNIDMLYGDEIPSDRKNMLTELCDLEFARGVEKRTL